MRRSRINDQLLFLNWHLVLQWRRFKLAIVIKLVIEIFQIKLLALRRRLAAEHVQTEAKRSKAENSNNRKDGHAGSKWKLVERGTQAFLGLQTRNIPKKKKNRESK